MRAGVQTLTLLGAPRIHLILQSLAEGTKCQTDLRRDAGSPAQSTLRSHLERLVKAGAIGRRQQDAFPKRLEYGLTEAGRELLVVAASVERWLAQSPRGSLELGADPARAAIKGLVDGWSATVLSSLAANPLSLTELDRRITVVSYPTLERCLDTMRLSELLEACERLPRGTPYALTEWLRRGLVPLAVGARWEHRHRPEGSEPMCQRDLGEAILVGAPLFEIPAEVNGICQLAVRISGAKQRERALGSLEVRSGDVAYGGVNPEVKPDAWASGTQDNWFATVIDADTRGLRMSGDHELTSAIFDGVHQGLFRAEEGAQPGGARSSSTS